MTFIYYDKAGKIKLIAEAKLQCDFKEAIVSEPPVTAPDSTAFFKDGNVTYEKTQEAIERAKQMTEIGQLKDVDDLKQFIIDKIL